ncbi:MAG TPA: RidA family protein, partial [Clostridia bacterium]|nr:RidA family protein [Clostridia bacterium]
MKLPEPLGPYSHFKVFNGIVFVSGQIPADNTVDIKEQTRQAIENLSNVLKAAGSGL